MRLFPWKLGFVCEGSGTGHVWRILVLHTGLISGRMLGHSINSVRRSWLNRNKSNYFPVSWFKNTLGKDKKKKLHFVFRNFWQWCFSSCHRLCGHRDLKMLGNRLQPVDAPQHVRQVHAMWETLCRSSRNHVTHLLRCISKHLFHLKLFVWEGRLFSADDLN